MSGGESEPRPNRHIQHGKSWANDDDDDDFITQPAPRPGALGSRPSSSIPAREVRDIPPPPPERGYGRDRGDRDSYRGGGYGRDRDRDYGGRERRGYGGGGPPERGYGRRGEDGERHERRRGPRRDDGEGGEGRPRHVQVPFEDTEYKIEIVEDFNAMGLKEEVLRGIWAKGFERPSLCQSQGIKALMDGKNLLIQAQSGQGKTAIFGSVILDKIDTTVPNGQAVQALIIVPSKELAKQVEKEIKSLGQFIGTEEHPLRVFAAMGVDRDGPRDESAHEERIAQVKDLAANPPHVLIGTIGRIVDLTQARERKPVIWLGHLKFLVLDEADEMLHDARNEKAEADGVKITGNFVFMQNMIRKVPRDVQVALVSATLSEEAEENARRIFNRHSFVTAKLTDQQLNRVNIQQFYVVVHRADERVDLEGVMQRKLDGLQKLVTIFANGRIYVFCKDKKQVEFVMRENSYAGTRFTTVVEEFRSGAKTVLVCTNALARGLDVQTASVVINFELCDPQRYMQRIGRVGRFGRAGTAVSLVPPYHVENSSGRPYTIEKITDVYKNTIKKWDFLETYPDQLEPWVMTLPGFGVETGHDHQDADKN